MLRLLVQKLPLWFVAELKRIHYRRLIKKGRFVSPEVEFTKIAGLINQNDWVIDIGANVGHYVLRFSNLVGNNGRVFAFEPIPLTFSLLSNNVHLADLNNVTLVNAAVSDRMGEVGFSVPDNNYYQSHLAEDGSIRVVAVSLLNFFEGTGKKISFVKIDAEGCDALIIKSSTSFFEWHRPIIMAEINSKTAKMLADGIVNYKAYRFEGSHNCFLLPDEIDNNFGLVRV